LPEDLTLIDAKFLADDPADVGIDPNRLDELLTRVAQEVDAGLLPACQVAVARNGRLGALVNFGDAHQDSLFSVFSATKAITSAAAWLAMQDGVLDTHERVADVIEEFAANGKGHVTVEQLFTHTAGFPHASFKAVDWNDRTRRLERFRDWQLAWEPGTRFEYHPTSSMWVIAELIERKTNTDFATFVRERIALPLGLPDMWLGCPSSEHHRVLPVVHAGEPATEADYAALGMAVPPVTEVTEENLSNFNKPEVREVPVPGGGGIMSAAELALFYQALLNDGRSLEGEQIWSAETLAFALKVRTNLPDYAGTPVNRALGVVVAGDAKRNRRAFGHTNSPLAFGHNGAGGQVAWGDPATGISFGYCTNGHDRHALRQARRGISISNRAAVCAVAQ
jgi:CubicO group peptidase (beta-lactamase class C family)